ncbi:MULTISPECIES: glycosyltransferase family 39 protein [unclassified Leptolyngbya]|uniref:glycosyltransferase family 39 protein n=1 Tax=unclassified Leptolyngbya TaxID=2650499 RepID=UPI0016879377|nr:MULTISPECIES: glycosyltransferase family 39 protein [unclassified Leptolyngbya]MBD1912530.1 glycosyltransferase family 39 protein [Leptolyngbya sp. FACHB-8]MBD2156459.1 glycosyltransferase family 39 protein [Leptolyngbya sp. FACHB-16]
MPQRVIFQKNSFLKAAAPFPMLALVPLMVVAVFLHTYRLDGKLYWHDEVYTSIRAAGYQRHEIGDEIFRDRLLHPSDLLAYQAIKPGSSSQDTIRSLAIEDPQHPPLYFLMQRWWMQMFGSSIAASRSLAVLFSLLALPGMYWLSLELFSSPLAAWLTTLLLALSPFDILFAQVARQYSLLTLFTILSSWFLLRALRLPERPFWHWGLYTSTAVGGLYTHPFFGLTLIAHGLYVLARQVLMPPTRFALGSGARKGRSPFRPFLLSMAAATLLFSPWLWVILSNFGRAMATTDWAAIFPGYVTLIKFWVLSFTALFFDLDFGFNNPVTFWLRVPYVLLILMSCYEVWRRSPSKIWLFILVMILVPFLLLVLPDLLLGNKRSTVSRYLIPCFPGVQLAVGFWLADSWARIRRSLWYSIAGLLLVGSLTSILVSSQANTWWNKDLSYFNGAIAEYINALPQPLVISDEGNDWTNLGDLISLSYLLKEQTQFLLLSPEARLSKPEMLSASKDVIYFRPSSRIKAQAEAYRIPLKGIIDNDIFQPAETP